MPTPRGQIVHVVDDSEGVDRQREFHLSVVLSVDTLLVLLHDVDERLYLWKNNLLLTSAQGWGLQGEA